MKKLEKISSSDMDKVIKNQRNYQRLMEAYELIEKVEFLLDETCISFKLVDLEVINEEDDEIDASVEIYKALEKVKEHIFNREMFRLQKENNKILGI